MGIVLFVLLVIEYVMAEMIADVIIDIWVYSLRFLDIQFRLI
jgi:hypothetical protein